MLVPAELVAHILGHLDIRDLLTCRAVCAVFRQIVDSVPSLLYKIELAIAGMEDGGHYPLAVRREMLQLYQSRWSDLDWVQERRVPMLYGGLWELYGNVLAQNTTDKSTLHFKQLPSRSRGIQEKDWSIDIRQFRVRDFGMDPGQDLLVILEQPRWGHNERNYRVYLRTMSTGEPHPLASGSRILTHKQQYRDQVFYSIQTCGDTLGVMFSPELSETEVVLWNWKTGQVLVNIVSDDIKAITFLSERHLTLGVLSMSMLEDTEPNLVAVDFIAEPPERRGLGALENAFTFHFPPMADITTVLGIEVRSDPASIWAPGPKLQVPFFTARHNRLFVVTLIVRTNGHFARALLQFVPGTTLLSLIQAAAGQSTAQFAWHTWGPEGSRMVLPPLVHSNTWVCYVYGTRYASMRVSRDRGCIYVYDFNQLALKWKQRQDAESTVMNDAVVDEAIADDDEHAEQRLLCVTAPTRFAAGEIFLDEIETRLGYRLKGCPLPGEADIPSCYAMCSEDGLVLVDEDIGVIGEYRILTV